MSEEIHLKIHLRLSVHMGMIYRGFPVSLLHLILYNFTFCLKVEKCFHVSQRRAQNRKQRD